MRKYIIQFAAQSVLCLLGWGVSLMPANTSWVPSIIIYSIALLWLIITLVYCCKYGKKVKLNVEKVVDELLSEGIFTDEPVNITRILYALREKLSVGLHDYEASVQDRLVLEQLNLRNIVQLEQRKVKVFGSDNVRDESYWILTELGKSVILYLQKNKQILCMAGSQS